jgi:hypothetical protein
MFFLGNQWGAFSNAYESIAGPAEIRPDVWEYYARKRLLEDITDWLNRILHENTDAEQQDHDLRGLEQDLDQWLKLEADLTAARAADRKPRGDYQHNG